MRELLIEKVPTIGCCGIDCGLCPRFYDECPGCGCDHFFDITEGCHPARCCVLEKGITTCAECDSFPCDHYIYNNVLDDPFDTFVTHRKRRDNLYSIWQNGMEDFLERQKHRIEALEELLDKYNDGSLLEFYCTACTLLPLRPILEIMAETGGLSFEQRSAVTRQKIEDYARNAGINLELRKRKS